MPRKSNGSEASANERRFTYDGGKINVNHNSLLRFREFGGIMQYV